MAKITSRCDWRILDLVEADHPVSLYLVVPPSDISRTKPLVRLILNQIGRRLTESLKGETRPRKLLFMLDEFPILGRLAFFEQELAFIAGYGITAFLIAHSLNQIERAYGPNNAILDNCHVRLPSARTMSAHPSASRTHWAPPPNCAPSATTSVIDCLRGLGT